MENIELRSEKVRNLIGSIPPFIIRLGNFILCLFVVILFVLTNFIKVPNTVKCDLSVSENDNMLFYSISNISRIIKEPIPKGTKVLIYCNDNLIQKASLAIDIDSVFIKGDKYSVDIPLNIDESIGTNTGIHIGIDNSSSLTCEIILNDVSILSQII